MAYLDATDWNDIQVTDAVNEKRFSQLGIVDAVKDSTPFADYIPPSAIEQLRKASSLRNVQIPVLKDQTVQVVQTPGFNFIPSNLPESDKYAFTAVDVFTGMRFYPAHYDNNQVDGMWAKDQVMKNIAYAAGNTIEAILASNLETRKTQALSYAVQVSDTSGDFNFNTGTDLLEVKKVAQKETMFYRLEQLMAANELGGQYRIVTSRGGLTIQKAEAAKYGANNEKNLQALGMLPANRMYESGNIDAGSDIFNGWFLRDGSIGVIENHPFDFRSGTDINGRKWSVSDVELPFARMRANLYVNNEPTEATALVGAGTDSNMIMTHFEEMAVWFRFYVIYRYNSALASRPNDIVKIKGLTT